MSKYQKVIILLTCLVIVGMCVYPPMYGKKVGYAWTDGSRRESTHFAGYHLFFKSPKLDNCRIDLERLGVQIFAVLVVGAGLFLIGFKKKSSQSEGEL